MMYSFVHTTGLQRVALVLTVASVLSLTGQGWATDRVVRLERIDGTTIEGQWVGSSDGQTIELRTPEGKQSVPRRGLREINFRTATAKRRSPATNRDAPIHATGKVGSALLYLADGGRLRIQLVDASGTSDAITCHSVLGTSLAIPFDHVAGIQLADKEQFPGAHKAFTQSLQNRPPGHDLLVTRDTDGIKKVQGRLEAMGAQSGSFNFGGQSRDFQNENIFGIVLAETQTGGQAPSYWATVHLIDGATFSGAINSATPQTLRVATSFGLTVALDLSNVARIDLESDRVVPLSDLEPIATKTDGLVHRPWRQAHRRCSRSPPPSHGTPPDPRDAEDPSGDSTEYQG